MKTRASLAFCLGLAGLVPISVAFDPGANDPISVSGRASPDYVRIRQADGTFAPETYVFGRGGAWPGSYHDYSIDQFSFLEVAHVVAGPLASQNYFSSTDPAKTNLLIMVYWGTSWGTGQTAGYFTRSQIEMQNRLNIRMLGYESWYNKTNMDVRGTALEQTKRDLYLDISENRYFVILMAYDFPMLSKEKKHRLLWEIRFSMQQVHHEFDKELPAMARYASRYFGQDTGGLIRNPIPVGQVSVGDVKSLGPVPPQ